MHEAGRTRERWQTEADVEAVHSRRERCGGKLQEAGCVRLWRPGIIKSSCLGQRSSGPDLFTIVRFGKAAVTRAWSPWQSAGFDRRGAEQNQGATWSSCLHREVVGNGVEDVVKGRMLEVERDAGVGRVIHVCTYILQVPACMPVVDSSAEAFQQRIAGGKREP